MILLSIIYNQRINSKNGRRIAKFYVDRLKDYEIFTLPVEKKNCKHSFHLFPLLVEFKKLRHSKQEVFKRFLKEGIKLQVHYIPIHLQPFYKKNFRINRKELENAWLSFIRLKFPTPLTLMNSQFYGKNSYLGELSTWSKIKEKKRIEKLAGFMKNGLGGDDEWHMPMISKFIATNF